LKTSNQDIYDILALKFGTFKSVNWWSQFHLASYFFDRSPACSAMALTDISPQRPARPDTFAACDVYPVMASMTDIF
jgi:hypothetical protein